MKLIPSTLILTALLAVPSVARADAKGTLQDEMNGYLTFAAMPMWAEYQLRDAKPAADCTAAIKKSKLKDCDELEVYAGESVMPGVKTDGSSSRIITVADAKKVCPLYADALAFQKLRLQVQTTYNYVGWLAAVKPEEVGSNPEMVATAKKCEPALDAMVAAGRTVVPLDQGDATIDEARVVCAQVVKDMEKFVAASSAAGDAKRDAIAQKYIDLGVGGNRLELFIEYDDVYWRGKGCEVVDDIKVQVKAKKLYQWLENSDGTHTIRTYSFKGNKYKIKEKTYATEAKAYKGCK